MGLAPSGAWGALPLHPPYPIPHASQGRPLLQNPKKRSQGCGEKEGGGRYGGKGWGLREGMGGTPPKSSWGQTHIWGLSIESQGWKRSVAFACVCQRLSLFCGFSSTSLRNQNCTFLVQLRRHADPKTRTAARPSRNRTVATTLCSQPLCCAQTHLSFLLWGRKKKPINKKTRKQNFHGIVPGPSRDCPDVSLIFLGNFVYVFPFSSRKRQHTNKFDPTHSRDNPEQ